MKNGKRGNGGSLEARRSSEICAVISPNRRDDPIDRKQSTIDALRAAPEAAGVEFTNGGQPGVRMRSEKE
jgi:hypothetical protein